MRAGPSNYHDVRVVSYLHFRSVMVALDVKDHQVPAEKTRRRIGVFDVLRRAPFRLLRIGNPIFDPRTSVSVRAYKIM